MHPQRGQATIDYVALLAVLALLLGAAAVAAAGGAPGLANAVVSQLRHALCIVTGGACPAELEPCVVASKRDAQQVAVTILIVRLDGDRYVLREDLSDGTVRLTIASRGGLGAEVAEGSRVQIKARGRTIAAKGQASAGGQVTVRHGEVYIAQDADEADAILRELQDSGPLGIDRGGRRPSQETFFEGGIRSLARAGISGPASQASLETVSDMVVGGRRNRVTGELTLTLAAGAAGSGLLAAVIGPSGSLDGHVTLTLKLDRDERPIELSLEASGTISGGGALGQVLSDGIQSGSGKSTATSGRRWEITTRVDLTAPGAAVAWSSFRRNPASLAAIRSLGDVLRTQGHLDVRTYAVSSESGGFAASVAHVLKLGGEVGSTTDSARLLSASTRPPGGAWERREDCLEAARAARA